MQLLKLVPLLCASTAVLGAPVGSPSRAQDVRLVVKDADSVPVLAVDVKKREAAAEAAAVAIADATGQGIRNILNLLEPENLNVIKLGAALIAFFASPITKILPARLAGELLPVIDVYTNNEIAKIIIPDWESIPGYNTVLDVPNVEYGRANWFAEAEDRQEDDPVILYAHGGGYLVGYYPLFTNLLNTIYEGVGNSRLSILALDYTVSIDKPYPQQLIEFTETFNKLSETSKNIIFLGDSAGVHLALQFLRHQNYAAYDGVPEAVALNTTGGIFLSPWVNVYPDPEDGSMATNEKKDYLTAEVMQHGTEVNLPEEWMYTDPAFNQYIDAIDWDSYLPEKVFVSRGENEILHDSIGKWAELAKFDGVNRVVFTDPAGVHDSSIFTPHISDIVPNVITYLKELGY